MVLTESQQRALAAHARRLDLGNQRGPDWSMEFKFRAKYLTKEHAALLEALSGPREQRWRSSGGAGVADDDSVDGTAAVDGGVPSPPPAGPWGDGEQAAEEEDEDEAKGEGTWSDRRRELARSEPRC